MLVIYRAWAAIVVCCFVPDLLDKLDVLLLSLDKSGALDNNSRKPDLSVNRQNREFAGIFAVIASMFHSFHEYQNISFVWFIFGEEEILSGMQAIVYYYFLTVNAFKKMILCEVKNKQDRGRDLHQAKTHNLYNSC